MGTLRYVERTGARVFTWRRDVTFLGDPDARAWWFQTIVIICYNLAKVLGKSWQSLGNSFSAVNPSGMKYGKGLNATQ